jgi:predicted nucleic acid-binding protein
VGAEGSSWAAAMVSSQRSPRPVIHVDTSFLIGALVRGSDEDRKIREWLHEGLPLGISTIAWAEFLCGPANEGEVQLAGRLVSDPEPFVSPDAALAARLFELAGRRRGTLADCMIAATAIRLRAALATGNVTDFKPFQKAGLRLAGTGAR